MKILLHGTIATKIYFWVDLFQTSTVCRLH